MMRGKGITGHECVNEIIVDRLLTVLGIEHLSYQLIHALVQIDQKRCETWLCASRDFKRRGESKIALDAYYQAERLPDESPMDFCIRSGWEETVYEVLVVDFLILNRDRHGANMEVLRNPRQKTIRLAPLFDHGLSLLSRCESIEDMLDDDMLTVKSKPMRIDDAIQAGAHKDHRFFEASSIRKIGGRYYFIHSSVNSHELCYATSELPDQDFV